MHSLNLDTQMDRLRRAVYDRRRGIGILAAVATGSYFICSYLSSKLSEIQDQAERDRVAKERCASRI